MIEAKLADAKGPPSWRKYCARSPQIRPLGTRNLTLRNACLSLECLCDVFDGHEAMRRLADWQDASSRLGRYFCNVRGKSTGQAPRTFSAQGWSANVLRHQYCVNARVAELDGSKIVAKASRCPPRTMQANNCGPSRDQIMGS
jgi:hypothetical protein